MQMNKSSLFWGILLILGGIAALAQQLGYLDQLPDNAWAWVFGALSLVGFVGYFTSSMKDWAWLFPAGVFGGLTVTVWLAISGVDGAGVGSPIFFGLLIPFLAAYFADRSHNWWALIPSAVMLSLAMVTLMVDTTRGEWIGSAFLFLIALSFFVVYLSKRTNTWALLVAYIMGVLGIAPLMATGGELAAYYGSVFMLAIALPFFVLYFRDSKNWWAVIPAGVMTTISILAGLAIAGWIRNEEQGGYANALLMGGLAATFAVVWLRNAKDWAKTVTIVLGALAVASIFFTSYTNIFWPLAIILTGGYLLFTSLQQKDAH